MASRVSNHQAKTRWQYAGMANARAALAAATLIALGQTFGAWGQLLARDVAAWDAATVATAIRCQSICRCAPTLGLQAAMQGLG